MKTKNIIMLIAALVLAANISVAQVKQHYKVVDYETGKPLSGVQINFEKQTAITNAKGIAVLFFADKHYGDFIEKGYLNLKFPEYVGLGPNWKSRFSEELLNKDTMVWYMMRADHYYAECDRIFDSLFAYTYRNEFLNDIDTIKKEIEKNPEKTIDYINEIIYINLYNWGKYFHDIVSDINKFSMYYINSDIRRECEQALFQGDFKKCLEIAKSQIVANDNSDINLQRIFYYLTIRNVMKDTTPASDYYKILFDNGFKNNTVLLVDYMNCLNEENQEKEVERFKQYAKDSCQDPWMKLFISRYFKSSADESTEETLIKEYLEITQLMQDSFPKSKIALAKMRAATASEYFNIGDTLHALLQLDTAYETLFQTDKNEFYSEFSYKKRMFFTLQDLMVLPNDNDTLFPIMKKLKDTQVRLASEIYRSRPSQENLILYFYTLKNVLHNYDSITFARIQAMDALLPELKEIMPEFMLPQQLSNKNMLYKGCLYLYPDSVSFYFNAYKDALAPCEAIYPYMYEWVLNDNLVGKTICYHTGNEYFVKHIDSYTHELLEKKSRLLHKDSLQEKANYFHIESEYLYKNNLFAQSITSYDGAINYYRRLCSTNDSAHLDIMTALLQKGDAYMQQKQLKEAFDCYQQVLDYPKLPAKFQTAQTINKAIVYHFQGDLFTMQENYKMAMKYYDKSEKEFKIVQKYGDTTFYGAWGEMHFNKALSIYYSGQEEKAMEEMKKAEKLYDRYPLNKASQKYETLKSILIEYHSNTENLKDYMLSLYNYLPYCDSMKYIDSEHYHTYINTAALLGDISNKMGWSSDAVRFYRMVKEGKDFLENYGEPKDLKYITLLYLLGKNYRQLDSLEQAVAYLIQCKELNYKLFSEKNPDNYKIDDLNIKNELALCYEEMDDPREYPIALSNIDNEVVMNNEEIEDFSSSNQWFNKALVLRKEIVAELSKIDTNDALRINLGTHHKLLGLLYLNMDYGYTASTHYDTALTILLPFYKSEKKENVEKDIAICYLSKALIEYNNDEDEETIRDEVTIKKLLNECLDVCENAVKPNNLMVIRYRAVSLMIEILENQLFSKNEAEIKKYHNLKADLEKQLSK